MTVRHRKVSELILMPYLIPLFCFFCLYVYGPRHPSLQSYADEQYSMLCLLQYLQNVKLPKNDFFTVIYDKTFFECANLEEVILPDSIYQIGSYAFANCKSLQRINLDNIKLLYDKAFAGTALEKITLTARKIGSWAFAQCKNLREADLSGITDRQINSHLFFECTSLAKISLPKEQIRIFDSNCFYHTALEKIVFDAKEVIVRQGAFGLTNLKKVVIGKTCDSIQMHDYAFHQADVEEFVIPESLSKHFNVTLDRIF